MSEKVSDVVTQLEALIAGIATKTPRECDKYCTRGHSSACDSRHSARFVGEIARTVERMINAVVRESHISPAAEWRAPKPMTVLWAAAFRATQEQETQK